MTTVVEQYVQCFSRKLASEIDRILTKLGFDPEEDRDWLEKNLHRVCGLLPSIEEKYYVGEVLFLEVRKLEPPQCGFKIVSYF